MLNSSPWTRGQAQTLMESAQKANRLKVTKTGGGEGGNRTKRKE